jgi:hypothetical protein
MGLVAGGRTACLLLLLSPVGSTAINYNLDYGYTDDEDMLAEGTKRWGDYYYDDIYSGGEGSGGDWEGVTDPPPYLDMGEGDVAAHGLLDGGAVWGVGDIELVEEEEVVRAMGGRAEGHTIAPPRLILLLLLLLLLPS